MSLVSIAPAEAEVFVFVVIGERLLAEQAWLRLIYAVANIKLTDLKQTVFLYAQSKVFNRHSI